MTPALAKLALQLLDRVSLKGAEVPAFSAVSNALTELAQPPKPEADPVPESPGGTD